MSELGRFWELERDQSEGVRKGSNHGNPTGCHHTETVSIIIIIISNWALCVLFSTGYLHNSGENGGETKNLKYS